MSDQTMIEMPEAEVVNLFEPESESDQTYHSLLRVWKAYLEPAAAAAEKLPSQEWVGILIKNWSHILKDFSQVQNVQKHYFRILADAKAVLDALEESDPQAFDITDQEEDAERNWDHYRHMMLEWQKVLLLEQADWSVTDPEAEAKFVALGEVQNQLVGKQGLVAFLGHVGLAWTEADQEALTAELSEFRASLEA